MAGSNGTGVISSRPTIAIGGNTLSQLSDALLSLRIEERLDGLSSCEATFGNWGPSGSTTTFLYFDRRVLEFGKELTIEAGGARIFQGRIAGLEASFPEGSSPTLTVLAEDRFQDLRMTRRTRTFVELSDSDVMRQLASDHSLRPEVDVDGGAHKVLAQLNQSDLAFLRERARAIDAELWLDGTTLKAKSHNKRSGGSLELGYGNELHAFTVLADLAGQRTSVTVTGWDVSGKKSLQETVSDAVLGGELKGGTSGSRILGDSLGNRTDTIAHTVPLTSQEAKARAEAIFKYRARRFLRGRGSARLDPKLRVGAFAKLKGLGPLFSGEYYVTEVCHRFDGTSGLRTEFVGERPGLGAAQ
jgi:phage protein D